MTLDEAAKRIRRFFLENKRMPSYGELGSVLGMASKRSGFTWAKKLIETGILGKDDKGKLFPKALLTIPHYGVIKAGYAVPAYTVQGDSLDLYQFILDLPSDIFSMTVKGDSMIESMIADGDMAILDRNKEPRNGDIVAALVDGDLTLKHFFNDDEGLRLVPANENYPIIYPEYDLQIEGVLINIIRKVR